MNKPRILILGAGKRVKQDVLPVLMHLGYQHSDLLILRKNHKQLTEFPQISCIQMNNYRLAEFNPELIISCLPTSETIEVIRKILNITAPKHLFVDTPVSKIYEDLSKLEVLSGISVLEDNHLVFFGNQLKIAKSEPRLIFVRKGLYDYHGVALLSRIFGKTSNIFFKIRVRSFLILVFKAGTRFIFWLGPRDYSSGEIYFANFRGSNSLFQKYRFDTELIPEWATSYMLENLETAEALEILGSNPIRYMPFWKRMALGENLGKFILNGENAFLTLDEALINERFFQKFR